MPTTGSSDTARCFARIAVPVPIRKLFTYEVTEEQRSLLDGLGVGARVEVLFARRRIVGTAVEWPVDPPEGDVDVRPLERVLERAPRLTPQVFDMACFMADYYLTSLGEAIETALPPDAANDPSGSNGAA